MPGRPHSTRRWLVLGGLGVLLSAAAILMLTRGRSTPPAQDAEAVPHQAARVAGARGSLEARAEQALDRGARFFRERLSVAGSYVWTWSLDLSTRRGEGETTPTQGWAQPPGTPSVGETFLLAWRATGEATYLQAARETARALTTTQLASGGWHVRLEFDPDKRGGWFYRSDVEAGQTAPDGRANTSVLDDDTTQSCLRFLITVDGATEGRGEELRQAIRHGLRGLMAAQYTSGGWPQRFDGVKAVTETPAIPARLPAADRIAFGGIRHDLWDRTHPPRGGLLRRTTRAPGAIPDWQYLYSFNDGVIPDCIRTLLAAHRAYGDREYLEAARRGGEFIVRAQLPEPQPAWAQQYNMQMEPAWGRRMEPPAVASAESAGALRALLDLYLHTGEERFLEPLPRAAAWFERSRLPDGGWARFYELRTNRPLYVTREYQLTYEPRDLLRYRQQGPFGVPGLLARWEQVRRLRREGWRKRQAAAQTPEAVRRFAARLEPSVRAVVEDQDAEGRWTDGDEIRSATFVRNGTMLARYIGATRGKRLDLEAGG